MKVLDLIFFLTTPRPGRIHALNSPFDTDVFKVNVAARWVRQGKAEIVLGVLVFKEEFTQLILRQFNQTELEQRADEQFERDVDYQYSGERTTQPSVARWRVGHSGRRRLPGAPILGVHKMIREWKPGSYNKE